MKQLIGSGLRKEDNRAVCCHPACLTYMLSTSWEINAGLDELQAGIKISGRNINNRRYVDDTTLRQKVKRNYKNLLMRVKEESEKASLKLNIKKTKITAASPITSWQT